jgi:Icc-related predicted phosphoesterase
LKFEQEDSIQKDLAQELFTKNARRTVYVFHTPPYKTNLDLTYDGEHVGSIAVRQFIEKFQPYLTLHGHIHETVKRSGNYREQIGDTFCLTAGNDNFGSELAVLTFDIFNPWNAVRKII